MFIATTCTCRFPCWPLAPIFGIPVLEGLLIVAGAVFSLVMLIDCLKRPASKFHHPLTKDGTHDRLIWAAAIVISALWVYFLGAIVYFFVVKRSKPESSE